MHHYPTLIFVMHPISNEKAYSMDPPWTLRGHSMDSLPSEIGLIGASTKHRASIELILKLTRLLVCFTCASACISQLCRACRYTHPMTASMLKKGGRDPAKAAALSGLKLQTDSTFPTPIPRHGGMRSAYCGFPDSYGFHNNSHLDFFQSNIYYAFC